MPQGLPTPPLNLDSVGSTGRKAVTEMSFEELGVETTSLNTAPGVDLTSHQRLLVGSVLDVRCSFSHFLQRVSSYLKVREGIPLKRTSHLNGLPFALLMRHMCVCVRAAIRRSSFIAEIVALDG